MFFAIAKEIELIEYTDSRVAEDIDIPPRRSVCQFLQCGDVFDLHCQWVVLVAAAGCVLL